MDIFPCLHCRRISMGLMVLVLIFPALACSLPVGKAASSVTPEQPQATFTSLPETALPSTPTSLPEATSVPTLTPSVVPSPGVSYEGIRFSFDDSLASGVNTRTEPAVTGPDAPPWEIAPTTFVFELTGYRLVGTFHKPRILVYPVQEYLAISESAKEQVDQLRQLLAQKPVDPKEIPFLPLWNAAQFMQAKVGYLDFQNGSGVRFLTMYGQAAAPINNESLFYSFQGLTQDGQFYVAAVLPTSHPMLPADSSNITVEEYQKLEEDFPNYLTEMERQLGAQADDSFTPSLVLLDAMIQSLRIDR